MNSSLKCLNSLHPRIRTRNRRNTSASQRTFGLTRRAVIVCACLALIVAAGTLAFAQTPSRVIGRPAAQPSVTLADILIGPVGTQAVFDVVKYEVAEVLDASGLLMLMDTDDLPEYSELAVRVQYTVLDPDSTTGDPRLLMRAYPVDVETGAPLGRASWEATYALTEGRAVWESGDRIPSEYIDLAAPSWLIDWPLTKAEYRPQGPLHAGVEWESPTTLPLPAIEDLEQPLPLTGRFVEWIELDGVGLVAHIEEYTSGAESVMTDVFDGLPARLEFTVEGYQDYFIRPGQFPAAVEQYMGAVMYVELVGGDGPMAGVSGHAKLEFLFLQTYEQDVSGEFTWPPAEAATVMNEYPELNVGTPVTGMLGGWSESLDDGTYLDVYTMHGQAGDRVLLRLDSVDFDAYLFLADDEGFALVQDDDSGGDLNALIRTTLPYTGMYEVWVNTWAEGDAGLYILSLEALDPFDLDAALALLTGLHEPAQLTKDELERIEWTLWDMLELVWEFQDDL